MAPSTSKPLATLDHIKWIPTPTTKDKLVAKSEIVSWIISRR
jgi:hypothetical protein